MDKEVVICCDIDDTLWDLLFYWVKYNNYLHNCGDVRYQLLDEDLNNYTTWSMSDKFINKNTIVSTPGIPLGIEKEKVEDKGGIFIHDVLEIGVVVMALGALKKGSIVYES